MEGARLVAKKVKVPEYVPLDDVLSSETAFLQAATALDIAAVWAVESKDSEQLGIVAAQYIELGSKLMGPLGEQEEDDEEHDLTSESFGFVPEDVAKEVANGRTKGRRRGQVTKAGSPRWSIPRVHKEHG